LATSPSNKQSRPLIFPNVYYNAAIILMQAKTEVVAIKPNIKIKGVR